MISTQRIRVWKSGPPPHIGWWNASSMLNKSLWRWWDGEKWSNAMRRNARPDQIDKACRFINTTFAIEWNDYYPANARVPRVDPTLRDGLDDEGRRQATNAEIKSARNTYQSTEIQIDDDAKVSQCKNGAVWVQAWVYVER